MGLGYSTHGDEYGISILDKLLKTESCKEKIFSYHVDRINKKGAMAFCKKPE